MKFSEQWLREWVNPSINSSELSEQLTLLGLEVDSCIPVVPDFTGVVVGQVLEAVQHPDADRLRVCMVDIGESEPVSIVCGGQNVRQHLKVPVAKVGAVLSQDFKIKKAKLRGVESHGMICSESELGLADTSSGIMELPEDAPIGMDIRTYMQLDDHIIDVDLTPNRGDCLSVVGIAREVVARNQLSLNKSDIFRTTIKPTINDTFPIKLVEGRHCPRYIGRVIKNLPMNGKTPLWMIEKLRRSGIRNIHPIVDITNFVMLELGQPLHAFDLDKLSGEIIVRLASDSEKVNLLDDQQLELDNQTLVIADHNEAQAIAGVKGGSATGVSSQTQSIFLESAFFTPVSIARTMRKYSLFTDSAHRFERGVDPNLPRIAIERATQLILEILGGEAGPLNEVCSEENLPKSESIYLRKDRVERVLGVHLDAPSIVSILENLNMQVKEAEEGWKVTPPSYRFDLKLEIDLIEELARIYGYENIPSETLSYKLNTVTESESQLNIRRVRSLLNDLGYLEAITYSFVDPKIENLLVPDKQNLKLVNPISSELSVMRSNHWSGLIQALIYNQSRQQERVRLFEIGLCFNEEGAQIEQRLHLGGILSGNIYPPQWGAAKRSVDFFDVKSDLENVLRLTRHSHVTFLPGGHSALHPGKSAHLTVDGKVVGYLGCLHPEILQKLDLNNEVYVFDLDLQSLWTVPLPEYQAISKFPLIKRDIAFIVNSDIPVEEILKKILDSADKLLKNVNVFDVYQGKGIEEGKKSVALGLIFQHDSRTLVDAEVNDNIQRLINMLQSEFNATLRD